MTTLIIAILVCVIIIESIILISNKFTKSTIKTSKPIKTCGNCRFLITLPKDFYCKSWKLVRYFNNRPVDCYRWGKERRSKLNADRRIN